MRHCRSHRLALLALALAIGVGACIPFGRSPQTIRTGEWDREPRHDSPQSSEAASPPATIADSRVRIQIATGLRTLTIDAAAPVNATAASHKKTLPAGRIQIRLVNATPSTLEYHLFLKSFETAQLSEAREWERTWRQRGYEARLIAFGRRWTTRSGKTLDNQEYWLSLGTFASEGAADTAKRKLNAESLWPWVRPQRATTGAATIEVVTESGAVAGIFSAPVTLSSERPVAASAGGDSASYGGALTILPGSDGALELHETVDVESYLMGVLPAEMPALWPDEALRAQAVAARSDVLAHVGMKNALLGFDFTDTVTDRVYRGYSGRHARADAAVAATARQILSDGHRIIPAVFSSNCGGWTEDNDTVWSSPPDPALRAHADWAGSNTATTGTSPTNIERWLTDRPPAYCAANAAGFRWSKSMTTAEVTAAVNKRFAVGEVREIELGDRGPSGRLEWVRVRGSKDSAVISKELSIRTAFGGLASAMFILKRESGPSGAVYRFVGGGRGHGVGLCQHGAKGMAQSGFRHPEILKHYYSGVSIDEVR